MLMTAAKRPLAIRWRALLGRLALTAVLLGALAPEKGSAEAVDAELLFLVDTSIVVSAQDFDDLLDGLATAFESSAVIDALQAGNQGRIAATLILFSGAAIQTVGVPWTSISSAVTAQSFATALRAATRPPASFLTAPASALDFATPQFGTETGGVANGFESSVQAITMITETFLFPGESQTDVQTASANALIDGVDVINGLTVGTFNAAGATTYYESNIVGGASSGAPGAVDNSPSYLTLISPAGAPAIVGGQIISLVPEPGTALLALLGLVTCFGRRRS